MKKFNGVAREFKLSAIYLQTKTDNMYYNNMTIVGTCTQNTNFVKMCVASKSLFPGKRASRTYRMSSVDVKPGNHWITSVNVLQVNEP